MTQEPSAPIGVARTMSPTGKRTCRVLAIAVLAALSEPSTAATMDARPALRSDPARRIFTNFPDRRGARDFHRRSGATRPVSHCGDAGPGSLRAALGDAASGDTIDLRALACSRITLETGAIEVRQDDLQLLGPGRDRLTIDGSDTDRVLLHPGRGELLLVGLTIEHGRNRAYGFNVAGGGCIASAGYVNLVESSVQGCYAGGEGAYGGALYAYSLSLTNSTISGNVAFGIHENAGTAAFGGGAFVYRFELIDSTLSGNRAAHRANPPLTSYSIGGALSAVRGGSLTGSTVDANYSAGRGGGIASFGSTEVVNSTLSGNVAAGAMGGALFLRRPAALMLTNSTLCDNHAIAGGALWLAAPGSVLQSSILFGNHATSGHFADIEGAEPLVIAGDHNLVGDGDPQLTLPPDTIDLDPLLGALSDNGGPTRTHALSAMSPAIDAGSNPRDLTHDQRGAPHARVQGLAADIGALERESAPPAPPRPVPGLNMLGAILLSGLAVLLARAQLRQRRPDVG